MECIRDIIAITSLSIGLTSLVISIIMYISVDTRARRLKIELSRLIADSHAFWKLIHDDPDIQSLLKERYSSFNHGLTVSLAGTDKKFAKQWIKNSKPESEWYIWEQHLQVKMDKYRKKKFK